MTGDTITIAEIDNANFGKDNAMANVYILTVDKFIKGVYASKKAAFNAISADKFTQTRRTWDGDEEFIPTADTVILGEDIYAHYNEYTNELIGCTFSPEDRVYNIKEYTIKH